MKKNSIQGKLCSKTKVVFKNTQTTIIQIIVGLSFFLFLIPKTNAQSSEVISEPAANHSSYPLLTNFFDIQKKFHQYEKEQLEWLRETGVAENEGRVPGYNQFKRWEWFNEQRTYPSGNFQSSKKILMEYEKFLNNPGTTGRNYKTDRASQDWVNLITPYNPTGTSAGMGRINCMAIMPGAPNTLLVGTACGGVWKSTNDGLTWEVLNTDLLPVLSIASIAIDPLNTNNIYLATGDNFAGVPGVGTTKQGHFSAGVYKSTNGGMSWTPSGLTYTQTEYQYPQQLLVDPVTPNVLIMATDTGIWRNTSYGDGAWDLVLPGTYYSIEFNPLNHNVVYATDGVGLWRSNNNGVLGTWYFRTAGYPGVVEGRVSLGITPADTGYVYLFGKLTSTTSWVKKSINNGPFLNMYDPWPEIFNYGYYDNALAVSQTNPLEVHVGGVYPAKSINGGATFNINAENINFLAPNYVHQDVKRMQFAPGSGTKLYALTDAGIYVTNDNGTNWTNISGGIQISQIYRHSSHPFSADTIYYGTQDCSSNRLVVSDSTIFELYGGDGFIPLVDYTNPQKIFVIAQLGNLRKSTTGSEGVFNLVSPGQCLWNTSYRMNPVNPETMYIGASFGVKKSTAGGLGWVNVTAGVLVNLASVAVTKADTNYVYAASLINLFKTENAGNIGSWVNKTPGLPVALAGITYIEVSSTDRDRVYVSFSGYQDGEKVYMSTNGGDNWINYSGTLPNVPVNCITYVDGSNHGVYAATDFGVFYRDSTSSDWTSYNTGLPNVIVNHLDVHYPTMKLRAGTYGRGIWESDLLLPTSLFSSIPLSACVGSTVNFSDQSSGNPTSWSWTFTGGIPATSNLQNPTVSYAVPGTYNVTLTTSNVNGSSTTSSSITVNSLPTVPTISNTLLVLTSSLATSYQWYLNGTIIAGETNQDYTVTQNGSYTVVITDANGCTATSAAFIYETFSIENNSDDNSISILPNPNFGKFTLNINSINGQIENGAIEIFDALGKKVYESSIENSQTEISLNLSKGVYHFEVMVKNKRIGSGKIVIQ